MFSHQPRKLVITLIISSLLVSLKSFTQGRTISEKMAFHFYNDNFFYDKEYYNFIADAYTLAGHIVRPELSFAVHPGWKLSIGIEAQKFWGINTKVHTSPVFYLMFQNRNHGLRFGSLDRNRSHKIVAPLFNPEFEYLPERREWGLQYLFQTENIEAEAWMDWHTFIRKNDSIREIINGGLRLNKKWFVTPEIEFKTPVQWVFHHRGGQINLKGPYLEGKNAMFTVYSGMAGGALTVKMFARSHFGFFSYYLFHHIQTVSGGSAEEIKFFDGKALWTGVGWYGNHWKTEVSYWHAEKFNAPLGADIFQTVSRKTDRYYEDGQLLEIYARHTEPTRFLWIWETGYYHNFSEKFTFRTLLHFYYQPYFVSIPPYDFLGVAHRQIDFVIGFNFKYQF